MGPTKFNHDLPVLALDAADIVAAVMRMIGVYYWSDRWRLLSWLCLSGI